MGSCCRIALSYACGAQDISSEHRLSLLEGMNITVPTYLNIMSPALGWLLGMAGKGSSKELFTSLFSQYREQCNNTMVLKHFVDVREHDAVS